MLTLASPASDRLWVELRTGLWRKQGIMEKSQMRGVHAPNSVNWKKSKHFLCTNWQRAQLTTP
jgi:hypothetical protein